jgi:small subunit ribosomal protein S2
VDYIIPGNDDALRAIKLYVTAVADACLQGKIEAGEAISTKNEFVEEEVAPVEAAALVEAAEAAAPAEAAEPVEAEVKAEPEVQAEPEVKAAPEAPAE